MPFIRWSRALTSARSTAAWPDDFDPWETLNSETVRILRYRQHKPDGTVNHADWLTDFPTRKANSLSLYHMAKNSWEIENQGVNDARNRYGLEHVYHPEANSILLNWLLTFLALVIEQLYRIRYPHRSTHAVRSAGQPRCLLWLSQGRPRMQTSLSGVTVCRCLFLKPRARVPYPGKPPPGNGPPPPSQSDRKALDSAARSPDGPQSS